MNQRLRLATVALVASLMSGYALAALSDADVERLNKDLTPTGATRAGNADNTIPEWKGGLKAPPTGWKPEQGYVDPFVYEKQLFTITGANADQYRDRLSPGLLALLKKHFTTVKHAKPPASRKGSSEWYVIAPGFKG